jgi:tripartite-type tricarboxylate transporter receptor subunit TctC
MRARHFAVTIVATLLRLAALLPLVAFAQQAYPNKPIRMIVPLAAASAVDNAARIVATRMSASLGQQIVIENVSGAAGLIGAQQLARAAPDGYTIGGFNDSIMTMLLNMHANLPWDNLKDFAPVSLVATIEWGLSSNRTFPRFSRRG